MGEKRGKGKKTEIRWDIAGIVERDDGSLGAAGYVC